MGGSFFVIFDVDAVPAFAFLTFAVLVFAILAFEVPAFAALGTAVFAFEVPAFTIRVFAVRGIRNFERSDFQLLLYLLWLLYFF